MNTRDFEGSLCSMGNVKPMGTFLPEDLAVQNKGFLERLARASVCKPIHINSAATIPRPVGAAIGSLTTTLTTPTTSTTSFGLSTSEELLRPLRAMVQRYAKLAHRLSNVFGKALGPCLPVHGNAAQQALPQNPCGAMPLSPAAQASMHLPVQIVLLRATEHTNEHERSEPTGLNGGIAQAGREWLPVEVI